MKLNKYAVALIFGLGTLASCNDNLELLNPNQQTSNTFGFNADDWEELSLIHICICKLKEQPENGPNVIISLPLRWMKDCLTTVSYTHLAASRFS